MAERRRYSRLSIESSVKCVILDRLKKNKISYEILSKTRDLSEGGLLLSWPKSWECKVCSNCLAWIFNHKCILKGDEESLPENMNKYLPAATFLQIELVPPIVPAPVIVKAKVAWTKFEKRRNSYLIGLCFLDEKDNDLAEIREQISSFKEKKAF